MTEVPEEDAAEQQAPLESEGGEVRSTHGDEVDPADAYEQDLVVPSDEDEWR